MPNLKTSKKNVRKIKKKTAWNLSIKKRYKRAIKQFENELDDNNITRAQKTLERTYKLLDKANEQKLLKANTVSRKKSRLTNKLNKVISSSANNVKNSKQST